MRHILVLSIKYIVSSMNKILSKFLNLINPVYHLRLASGFLSHFLKNGLPKLYYGVKSRQYHIFLATCIGLISIISYNLGQINSLKKTPVSIKESAGLKADIFDATHNQQPATNTANDTGNPNIKAPSQKLDTRVVVSKNSDKYHYSWCSGAKRIKPENQIWFTSAQEAENRGYVLAGNCN